MKRTVSTVFIAGIFLLTVVSAFSIEISDYRYELTNGVRIKVERGWNQTNASLVISSNDNFHSNRGAVLVDMRLIGDLTGPDYDITLYAPGKKTPVLKLTNGIVSGELSGGKYNAVFRYPLQLGNGMITFQVRDIPVKGNSLSALVLTWNDIQADIEVTPAPDGKLAIYRFLTSWAKGKNDYAGFTGYPAVFENGSHDRMITPTEIDSDTSGKIRQGTYDLYLDTDISNARFRYTCWIERVKLDAGKSYTFRFNLNASKVITRMTNENPKSISFYPAGSAKKQGLKENKKTVLYSVQNPGSSIVCPTGIYDVLLNYNYGEKLEWRENVEFKYGNLTEIQ